jgi:pimeloyl-ACP methyl ester carboxylesterase
MDELTVHMAETKHRFVSIGDVDIFYRQAGDLDAPAVLLLHGFPSSSFQFRHMLAGLSDQWNLLAPDLPGFGFTMVGNHQRYSYSFDNLADTIARWIEKLNLKITAAYLHDYGGHVGFRALVRNFFNPRALII